MKRLLFSWSGCVRILGCLLAGIAAAGCVSPGVDWNSRVGSYTHDQAVAELGPPDKSAKLTDGTTVAEWLTRRGYSGSSVAIGHGYWEPYYYHPYYHHPLHYHHYLGAPSPDYYIRLTFAPDGKLQSWKRLTR